ncbi:MAG: PEP-CTERM sorting domain-containing protein [Pirellulales bacterium]
MLLFNYNEFLINRGVNLVEILVSNDNFSSDTRSLGTFDFDPATGNAFNPGQFVDFGGMVAQFIMLDILSSQGDSTYVGLNEVEFYGSLVPEPTTWAMILLGAASIPWMLRRKHRLVHANC